MGNRRKDSKAGHFSSDNQSSDQKETSDYGLREMYRYDTYRQDSLTGDLTSDFPPKRPTGNETADTIPWTNTEPEGYQ